MNMQVEGVKNSSAQPTGFSIMLKSIAARLIVYCMLLSASRAAYGLKASCCALALFPIVFIGFAL